MEWGRDFSDSVDVHESRFLDVTQTISRLQAIQLEELEWLDQAQVFTGDGSRNLSEWVAAKADVSNETGRSLAQTMRRTQNKPWIRQALWAGAISFDRAEALSRIPDNADTLSHLDVAGVRRAAADLVEITRENEMLTAADRYLVMQPSIDESWWKIWGGLDGVTGAAIDNALNERADQLPEQPDGSRGSHAWRRATALYVLATGGESPEAHISLFIDTDKAAKTEGRAGVRLEAGPRVGAHALDAVLCDAVTEVLINCEDASPLSYGRKSRVIPPRLRRAILNRTAGHCAKMAAIAAIGSKSITGSPGHREDAPTPTTWWRCVGSITTSWFMNADSNSMNTPITAASDFECPTQPLKPSRHPRSRFRQVRPEDKPRGDPDTPPNQLHQQIEPNGGPIRSRPLPHWRIICNVENKFEFHRGLPCSGIIRTWLDTAELPCPRSSGSKKA